jgi:hypothetical protein
MLRHRRRAAQRQADRSPSGPTTILKCLPNERLSIDTSGLDERCLTSRAVGWSAYAADELLGGTPDPVWQRAANASCSLWPRTVTSNAGAAKSVVGSGKRPTQTTARRLRYGVARSDTSDFSAPRGRHHCRNMWIHRISGCAEKQATRMRVLPSGLLLWMAGRRDRARKASRPERARSRRPVR